MKIGIDLLYDNFVFKNFDLIEIRSHQDALGWSDKKNFVSRHQTSNKIPVWDDFI